MVQIPGSPPPILQYVYPFTTGPVHGIVDFPGFHPIGKSHRRQIFVRMAFIELEGFCTKTDEEISHVDVAGHGKGYATKHPTATAGRTLVVVFTDPSDSITEVFSVKWSS